MRIRLVSIAALLSGLAVCAAPPPVSAASITVSGTEINIVSTADEAFNFACTGGATRINGAATSPTLACSALTKVTVTSINSTDQTVIGTGLNLAAFTAGPSLTANLGGGDDRVTETDRSDTVNLGGGEDTLTLRMPTTPNGTLELGADGDQLIVNTISADDTTSATSTNNAVSVTVTGTGGSATYTALNAEALRINTLDGDDTLSTTGITAASSIDSVVLSGGDGDDKLTSGSVAAQLQGNTGTNDINGGSGPDIVVTASDTDDISTGAGTNEVLDYSSLHSGGRTVAASTANDTWYLGHYPGDSVTRIHPTNGTTARLTASLTRPGQQVLTGYNAIEIGLNTAGEPQSASIVDVTALSGTPITITGKDGPKELLDLTVPSGSWSVSTLGDVTTIDLSAYGDISAINLASGNIMIHAPWTNLNQGYAHRVLRDLLFRLPSAGERQALREDLDDNTKTPTTAVLGIMDTDEYRGLDVDRVFVKYLRRTADAGGRTYWINSLDGGKALWRFRAQLFGSAEYFNKAGGTNALYVTRAYNDVLGRNPDPSGQTYWTNKLNNGADRGSVALQFMNSPEARRRLVDDQYLRFLNRYPTPTEQNFWVGQIPTATGEIDLIRTLTTSSAYRALGQ